MSSRSVLSVLRTLVAFSLWWSLPNLAYATEPHAEVSRTLAKLGQTKGPALYTAVRELWAAWGTTDPRVVESALVAISEDTKLEERVRAYAAFFAAHARTRRGDIQGAKRRVAQLGYVSDWLVLGPFDNEGKGGFGTDFGPEAEGRGSLSSRRTYTGKERPVRWRATPTQAFPLGWLEGSALFRPEEHVCYYAATEFLAPPKASLERSLWVGASGAVKVFINGKQALSDAAYRGHDVDQIGVRFQAAPGQNLILVKTCGTEVTPVLSLRVANANGGPLAEVPRFTLPELTPAENSGSLPPVRILDAELGPIARFEKQIAGKQPSAEALEAYANYLVVAHADDPANHWARDYARRAAEQRPTVARLLLAGSLAEDENQRRVWVERAEAASSGADPDVILARADLERSGLSWRDAFPHYRRALAVDPANLEAVQSVAQMYSEVGLSHSALSVIESALRLEPASVNLLNLKAFQLRSLGREREAVEAEARYAQFRFDDAGYLSQCIDSALAAQDNSQASHWIERLLELNPGSGWAHNVAATAFRRMGESERALQELKRALELAPEDVTALRALSDVHGELGARAEQKRLLHQILSLKPQTRDVAEYVEHIEPDRAKQDEAYAWSADRFLKQRSLPAGDDSRRTLVDLSVVTVFENGLSSQFRQVVFQPLTDSAAALTRNYLFSFQGDTQQVQLRGAKVYRMDGRVDEAVETGSGAADDPTVAMYTSAQTYYVQFPRLEPGDVVELRYRIDDVTPRNEYVDYFGDLQYLQKTEPIGHAEYVLIAPKTRKLYIDHHGLPKLTSTVQESGAQKIYRFAAENIPGVDPEPAMPALGESLGYIHVSTFKDYEALGRWFWGLAQDQFDLDDETRKLVHKIADARPTEAEKVAAVYNWVIANTRYVALEFGIYGVKPRRCVQTVARGWGDCKDKATVIVSLLRELGIDSTIVILRTQMRGAFHSKVASLAAFDHAIAYVPSLDLYLDGTAESTGTHELPAMDQGALGILVNQGKPKLVELPITSPKQDLRRVQANIALEANARADVRVEIEVKGTQAPSWRMRYQAKGTQRTRATSDLASGFPAIELSPGALGLSVESEDFEKPVRFKAAGRVPALGRVESGNISLSATTRTRLVEQFAQASGRQLDVKIPSFGTIDETYNIALPKGYRLISGPAQASQSSRFGHYSVEVKEAAGSVQVHSVIALDVSRIASKDYAAWREFCQQVDAAMSTRLVVGK